MVIMLTTKKERSITRPTSAVKPSATMIETMASTIGMPAATSAPKTTTRIDQGGEQAEPSPLTRSLSASLVKRSPTEMSPTVRTW